MRTRRPAGFAWLATALLVFLAPVANASSHMDAPLLTLDDAANTTDVYAFVSERDGEKYLSTALAVYPFEEPGIGPNNYRFDDRVRYEIHLSKGRRVERGGTDITYRFEFDTEFRNQRTILQAFQGVIRDVGDDGQNMVQRYTVSRVVRRGLSGKEHVSLLGTGIVPPNNQGLVTPFYNRGDNGESPAKDGVGRDGQLDRYTQQSIAHLADGYVAFAGQRDDGFYADIQAVFDALSLRTREDRFDSQGGFNVHMIALDIPIREIGGDMQVVGIHATTSRKTESVLRHRHHRARWVQVGRQGNPLFNEGFVALEDKDRYNRTSPRFDRSLFKKYATEPELARLVNALVFQAPVAPENGREDLAGIFIPDVIRIDLSTPAARLAGGGPNHPTNPDDPGFSRLSVFGGDTLMSRLTGGPVAGGWPNGRRFGDDVVDIGVTAVINDLADPGAELVVADGIDNVSENDIAYNKVFPYGATPLNGRNHGHHN